MAAIADSPRYVWGMDGVPFIPWRRLLARMHWEQGEHVTVVGPTGLGKTEVIVTLLKERRYGVFLGTKNKDSTQDELTRSMDYRTIHSADGLNIEVHPRYLVKPSVLRKANADVIRDHHREVFREVLMRVYAQGNWTLSADELRYLTGFLGLTDEFMLLILQGRSEGISILSAAQRPKWVPLEVFSMPVHLFFFRDVDKRNVETIADIVSVHRQTILNTVPRLRGHDVLYVNTRTGDLAITNTRS